jgi:hypothetical protein
MPAAGRDALERFAEGLACLRFDFSVADDRCIDRLGDLNRLANRARDPLLLISVGDAARGNVRGVNLRRGSAWLLL